MLNLPLSFLRVLLFRSYRSVLSNNCKRPEHFVSAWCGVAIAGKYVPRRGHIQHLRALAFLHRACFHHFHSSRHPISLLRLCKTTDSGPPLPPHPRRCPRPPSLPVAVNVGVGVGVALPRPFQPQPLTKTKTTRAARSGVYRSHAASASHLPEWSPAVIASVGELPRPAR